MREYIKYQATSYGSLPGTGLLERLWRNWKAHRAIVRLEKLDDHLLADIGVTRGDVDWAAGLPLTINAALALEEAGRQRRAQRCA